MKKYKVLAAFVSLKGGKTFRFGQTVTSEQLSKDEADMWLKNGHIEKAKESAADKKARLKEEADLVATKEAEKAAEMKTKEAKEKEEAELARLETEKADKKADKEADKSLTNAAKNATK